MTETMASMADVLSLCIRKGLTFAAYRLPRRRDVTAVIQKDHRLDGLDDFGDPRGNRGFVFAPFAQHAQLKRLIIHPDILVRNQATEQQAGALRDIAVPPLDLDAGHGIESTPARDFRAQAGTIVSAIRQGVCEKVVLSRVKSVKGAFPARLGDIFESLCRAYADAFVYIVNIHGHCWCGATPEPLLCSHGGVVFTDSLAGTRPFNRRNIDIDNWNAKERREHLYVEEDIENVLRTFPVAGYNKQGPFVRRAGALLHLCARFSFQSPPDSRLSALIDALHPSPAICGVPREAAMRVIATVEKHDRQYYGGYLGPVGIDDRLQLFVNLRCMKVNKDRLTVFAGSGITADSLSADEWEETEMKSETVLRIVGESGLPECQSLEESPELRIVDL